MLAMGLVVSVHYFVRSPEPLDKADLRGIILQAGLLAILTE